MLAPLKRTRLQRAFARKFSRATWSATGSLSMAQILRAPNRANAMAKIPEPVPTSSAENYWPPSLSATMFENSMQLRVVACVPVPKAMPGSMVITLTAAKLRRLSPRRRNPETFADSPRFDESLPGVSQSSCLTTFQ